MDIAALMEDVKRKSEADTTKNGEAHVQLLESIRQLTLAAETPAETLMRMRFEVCRKLSQASMPSYLADEVLASAKCSYPNCPGSRCTSCNREKGWQSHHCIRISEDDRI